MARLDRFPSSVTEALADPLRLELVGQQLGVALDARELPVTRVARPGARLIDVVQPPRPLVTWSPSPWQMLGRKLRRLLKRIF